MKPQGSGASGIVPYQAFRANDGWIVIGGGNDGLFVKIAIALDRLELGSDARFVTNAKRVENRRTLIPLLEDEIAKHSIAEVQRRMDAQGVPNAPVQRIDQVVHDEHAKALAIIQSGPEGALPRGTAAPLRRRAARVRTCRTQARSGRAHRRI